MIYLYLCTGREDDDHRLITDAEEGRSLEINNSGAYPTCCIELSLDGLAVNTVLQSSHINDYEGACGSSISFDWAPQVRGAINWGKGKRGREAGREEGPEGGEEGREGGREEGGRGLQRVTF